MICPNVLLGCSWTTGVGPKGSIRLHMYCWCKGLFVGRSKWTAGRLLDWSSKRSIRLWFVTVRVTKSLDRVTLC